MVKIGDKEKRKIRHELEDAIRPSAKFVRFIADCAGLPDNRQCSEAVIGELESVFAEKEKVWSEERAADEAIRNALSDIVDGEVLYIKRRKNVTYVCKHDNIYRWVARIKILKRKKLIGLPNYLYKGCEWHEYKTTDDIIKLRDRLEQALDLASFDSTRQQLAKSRKTANTPQ